MTLLLNYLSAVICAVYLSTSTVGKALVFARQLDVYDYAITSGGKLSESSIDGGHAASYGAIDGYLERMSVFGNHFVASGSVGLRIVDTDDFGTDYNTHGKRDYSDVTGDGRLPLRIGISALHGMGSLRTEAQNRADWLLPSATNITDTGWVTNRPSVFSEMAATGGLIGVYASVKDIMEVGGVKNGFINGIIGDINRKIGTDYYSRAVGAGGENPTGFMFSNFDEYTHAVFGDSAQYYQSGRSVMASGLRGRYILPLLDGKIHALDPVKKWTCKKEVAYKGLTAEIFTDQVKFSLGEGYTSFDKFMSYSDGTVSTEDASRTDFVTNSTSEITLKYRFPGYYIHAKIVPSYRWDNMVAEMDVSTNVSGYIELANGIFSSDECIFQAIYEGSLIGYVTLRQEGSALGDLYGSFTLGRERLEESLSDIDTYADESDIRKSRLIYSRKSVEAFVPVSEVHKIKDAKDELQFIETNHYFRARSYYAQSEVKSQALQAIMDGVAFLNGRMLDAEKQSGEFPEVTNEELEQMFNIFKDKITQRMRIAGMNPRPRYQHLRVHVAEGEIVGYEGKDDGGEWADDPMPIISTGGEFDGFDDAARECGEQFIPERIEEIEMALDPMIYLMEMDFGWGSYKWKPSEQ